MTNFYGIFDKLDGYRLLRFSNANVGSSEAYVPIPGVRGEMKKVFEVCLPDIEYSQENIGKQYNPETKTFLED